MRVWAGFAVAVTVVAAPLLPQPAAAMGPPVASAPGVEDAFWVYDDPSEEAAKPIDGMLAPWPGRVEVIVG